MEEQLTGWLEQLDNLVLTSPEEDVSIRGISLDEEADIKKVECEPVHESFLKIVQW